ncbi:ribonucleoside-diphosphate reductase class II [Christensenella hongkongensis]|uniref:Vitamin B12-dependent ribonucleotide reductase n=2 Tax=Christensenella hongkongensis TaxID=270498 RepID=A0A0M2NMN9_9FIRM|nr:vitamin B12-dependent ribonucleotide reductase [Christensenella hongkongensis]KKI52261.1 Ribonucleotide reductase of class II (coenzyme B12-dependent) [Christensenella hongkongensis]TCW25597.1 ribonucleoside-diphosphate reductase class II [Christensenella hongkongensis]
MLSKNAVTVLERRYLKKDADGKPTEKPDDLFKRVAQAIAQADKEYDLDADVKQTQDIFYEMMSSLKFMPNSPTLMNAGRPLGQLSACFVLPIADSMEDIFDAVKNAALIHKSGGGTGFSFSRLRGAGSSVNSTGGVASGPVSFMKVFNSATEAVKQGGTRRGANMGILRVDHPDIIDFIQCKKNTTEITNFNISVGITEEFMKAVNEKREYSLIDPHSKKEVKKLYAPEVFDLIVTMAWTNGEPGIVFLDRINRDNPVPKLGEVESTNPCGEQPLLPYESCNLGSINLDALMVKKGGEYELDYDEFRKTIKNAVHFLDNVIAVNNYPLQEIRDMTLSTRKIGLGLMGFADILYKLKIPYNSSEAIELAEKVMKFLRDTAREESCELAKQRGTFPTYDESIFKSQGLVQRNATVTTIAPTGTISIICGASSGIEPIFGLSYIRNVMDNDELLETHPYFEQVMEERGLYSKELMSKIAKEGTIAHMEEIPQDIRDVFVTAHDITPDSHVRMQAAFQKYTDNAVSKTVNFPREATKEDVRKVYELAYDLGLKGVTIYRDGSRDAQVLNIGKVNKAEGDAKAQAVSKETAGVVGVSPRQRPEVTQGITQKVKIGCGNLYITVNYDENGICEVFTNLGRAGGCPSQSEATSRLISTALRSGMDVESVVEQLRGIRCHSTLRKGGDVKVLSCPDAIGRVLQTVAQMQGEKVAPLVMQDEEAQHDDTKCPECGKQLEFEGGCNICRSCGYSKCG